MLLIGAGQLSRYVAQFALALDYEVIVCDPREEYGRSWQVAGTRLDKRMPDDAVTALASDHRCVVMALSHDPKLDDMALMNALNADLFYVGALGSHRNTEKRRERLATLGISAANLAQLHGPIGLPIGSKTPPEIAIAILAELTAARHNFQLTRQDDLPVMSHAQHASA
jgi:xanthine dehydrogenase accessory factor